VLLELTVPHASLMEVVVMVLLLLELAML